MKRSTARPPLAGSATSVSSLTLLLWAAQLLQLLYEANGST